MASVQRGLEVYSYGYVDFDDPSKVEWGLSVGNFSTTPLENFEFILLDQDGHIVGSPRRTARLIQHSNIDARFLIDVPSEQFLVEGYRAWICASGNVAGSETRAYFTVELEGHPDANEMQMFSVIKNDVTAEPDAVCRK
ncbi:hypothetical protein [Thioclava sp. GXIMD4216]|uniref:hypothetical protein n=1 Tax=Thioclava sp. GXIMD4216 TaxID=3131929 RepID=UPI0030D36540